MFPLLLPEPTLRLDRVEITPQAVTLALCTTAFIEDEVVEISRTVGRALAEHYGCRPDWGAMNYLVHEEVEREEAGETEHAILQYIRTPEDRRAAEQSMREMHRLLENYARGLGRERLSARP